MAAKPSGIAKLDKQIVALRNAIRKLNDKELDRLQIIIHGNGWTTIAEEMFVGSVLGSLLAQVKEIGKLKSDLVRASARVGRG